MMFAALSSLFLLANGALAASEGHLGCFLKGMNNTDTLEIPLRESSKILSGVTHYRLVPGLFPKGIKYHFDGLATVMSFRFDDKNLVVRSKYFESGAKDHYERCIFLGVGTFKLGLEPCLTNPGVNLLPINDQLWLTIDTAYWGRVDKETLETIKASVKIKSLVLNAHPACDPRTGECFVQYPCSPKDYPLTNQACMAQLVTSASDLTVLEIARLTLPANKLIQHSHSPCITPNYIISKLDSFGPRLAVHDTGMLKFLHQVEDNQWMVYSRQLGESRLMTSGNTSFVNNHVWNCFETDAGVVIDTVAATEDYLDAYFGDNLDRPTRWDKMFQSPYRCVVPTTGTSITCENLFREGPDASRIFDYPTFNPLFKMNPEYRFFYAIAAASSESRWFDQLIKVDARDRRVVTSWSRPGIYLTEADFVAATGSEVEDDGFLLSVVYDSHTDSSSLAVFGAARLELLEMYPLGQVIPFHAHGITCVGRKCFPNP